MLQELGILEGCLISVTVAIFVIDQSLEVSNLDHFPSTVGLFDQAIHLLGVFGVLGQELLDHIAVEQLVLGEAENLERLLLGDEAALDPESFFSYLTAALICKFLHLVLVSLFIQIILHLGKPLCFGERANVSLILGFQGIRVFFAVAHLFKFLCR